MEWETIVNQHAITKKQTAYCTRRKKFMHKSIVSSIVASAFVVATLLNLMKPVLGEVGMMFALLISVYNIGRAKECA